MSIWTHASASACVAYWDSMSCCVNHDGESTLSVHRSGAVWECVPGYMRLLVCASSCRIGTICSAA